MKKYLVVALVICVSFLSFSQEENDKSDKELEKSIAMLMQPKTIELVVDEEMFTKIQENTYMNSDQTAGIVAMQMPASFEKMKKDMNKEEEKEGQKLLDKGSFIHNGEEILFVYYEMTRGDQIAMMDMYCKKHDKESSITITSFYPVGEDSKYKELIKKAVITAQLKK